MALEAYTAPTFVFSPRKPYKKVSYWAARHSVYRELKALFFALQLLCACPLSLTKEGKFIFKWYYPKTLLSLLCFCLMTALAGFAAKQKISDYKQVLANNEVDNLAFFYGSFLLMLFQFLPVFMIIENAKLACYLNTWNVAQDTYSFMTGKELRLPLKKYLYIMSGFSAFTISAVTFYLGSQETKMKKSTPDEFNWYQMAACIYHLFLITMSGTLWTLLNISLQHFSDNVLYDIKDVANWRGAQIATVRRFVGLWLQLRNLTCQLGHTFCMTGIYFMLCQFFINVAAIYEVTVTVTKGGNTDSIFACIPCVAFLTYVSECAHRTVDKVGPAFQNLIMERRNAVDKENLEKEWKRFHDFTVMHPPYIGLAGYITLNRGLNVSIFGSYVTYVVIFMQMNSSAVCGNHTIANPTPTPSPPT